LTLESCHHIFGPAYLRLNQHKGLSWHSFTPYD
jgi:hypothetical protein